jgi:NAD+ synthase
VPIRIRDSLVVEPRAICESIAAKLHTWVGETLKRRGLVVAMSGGVDSSVCAALAVRALGRERVFGVMMPEKDSGGDDLPIAESWARELGIGYAVEDITPVLEAAGCYARRDAAIRSVEPSYGPGWRSKIVLGDDRLRRGYLAVYFLVVQPPLGEAKRYRLPPEAYREIVAATNYKQRVRKMQEYYHADRLHYAVLGTPNRLEYDQGFFVKGGDGLADVKPIAHLYKTQVYQLAQYLGVPEAVTNRTPTTGTYSLPQTQEEFYFSLPPLELDVALAGFNRGITASAVAAELGRPVQVIEHAYEDIKRKRATTRYLHMQALLLEDVPGVG